MKIIIIILCIFTILGCTNNTTEVIKNEIVLDNIPNYDTLTIQAQFPDCGEWGGHREKFKIFKSKENILLISFERDTVNCPDPALFDRRIIEQSSKELTRDSKKVINSFINKIINKCISNNIHGGNSGHVYSIKNANSNLNMIYKCSDEAWNEFEQLKKVLKTKE